MINRQAQRLFALDEVESVYYIFPDLKLTENPPHFSLIDFWGNPHLIRCKYVDKLSLWQLDIDRQGLSDWERFSEYQKILHEMYLDLYSCKDEKEIYRRVVEDGLKKLKLDRIGILLFSIEDNLMIGSWGTDSEGHIVDQSDFETNLDNEEWALKALKRRNYVVLNYDYELRDRGTNIGIGWNALAAFYDGDKPIGWVACDNYFSKKPLPEWKREIIGELGRITGRLVSRTREEQRLSDLLVKRTNSLKESQKQLLEAEKMASFGTLVAGLSHELNTPVGIALTAASHILDSTGLILENVDNNNLKKKELLSFLQSNYESGKITLTSLKKAAELVSSFKKLSVERGMEVKSDINLYEIIETISISLKYTYSDLDLTFNNRLDTSLHVFSYAGDFIQIFTCLIQNSIIHGFSDRIKKVIKVEYKLKEDDLYLTYSDDGKGLVGADVDKIFEPFYTSTRHLGGTGLGLSIIYNLVAKLGGIIRIKDSEKGLSFEIVINLNKLN